MKITITKDQLLAGLQTVQSVISSRSSMPVLSNVYLSAENESLEIVGTDLDVTICAKVKAEVKRPGKTTLPAKRLFSIIKELNNDEISMTTDEENRSEFQSGAIKFKMYGISAESFPMFADFKSDKKVLLDQAKLTEVLKRTSFAASQDEVRQLLNGTFISFKEHKIVVVATDGRRLALVEEEVDALGKAVGDIILPNKAVNEVSRLLTGKGKVEISFKENTAMFDLLNEETFPVKIVAKLVEGVYPNYRQVIPTESKYRVEFVREELLSAMKRAELMTSERQSSVKLSFTKNLVTVSSNTQEVGEFSENIAIKYDGDDFSIAFNPVYIIEPLSALTEDVVYFELTDEMSPGVIKINGPFIYVVMPMRLQ